MVSVRTAAAPRVWRVLLMGACGALLTGVVVTDILWNMSLASMFYSTHVSDAQSLSLPPMAVTTSLVVFRMSLEMKMTRKFVFR